MNLNHVSLPRVVIICICIAMPPPYLYAQTGIPLAKNATVSLTIEESGKISSPPAGFTLIENAGYTLKVKIKKPVDQQKELWKMVAEKCKETKRALDDPDSKASAQFQGLYSAADLTKLKGEMDDMIAILSSGDPKKAFELNPNTFLFFMGRAFIGNELFGNIFTVYNSATNTTVNTSINDDFNLSLSFNAPPDSFRLMLRVANLSKQFTRNYYLKARNDAAAVFNFIAPKSFYSTETPELFSIQKSFDSLYKVVAGLGTHTLMICDSRIVQRYNELIANYTSLTGSNNLIKISKDKWLGIWFWYNGGKFQINPLPFTDAGLLELKVDYDEANAKQYNDYVLSAIKVMHDSKELNRAKTDYHQMDSLLQQQGKGKEVFSNRHTNDLAIKANNIRIANTSTIEYTISKIIFKSIADKKKETYFVRTYDADKKLKGSSENFAVAVSNDVSVDAMVYNLKAAETLDFKETPVTISDQSKIITQLNEIGDAGGVAMTQATAALPIFSGLVKQFVSVLRDPDFSPLAITKENSFGLGVLGLPEGHNKAAVKNYLLKIIAISGSVRVKLFADRKLLDQSKNLLELVDQYLNDNNLSDCPEFTSEVHKSVIVMTAGTTKSFAPVEGVGFTVSQALQSLGADIINIIESLYKKRKLQTIYDDIAAKRNNLTIITDLFGDQTARTLPPKDFKSEQDNDPVYRNQYVSFGKEKGAKQKDFTLTVIDSKTKNNIKLDDTYKTAPTHWISASLGAAYIFNEFRRSDATMTGGTIVNTSDEDQVRLITGLNIYLIHPIILTDDRIIFKMKRCKEVLSRFSIFAGVSYPKPLYNLHPGLSVDIWAGVKITAGAHFFRYTNYKVLNNQVVDQSSTYVYNGIFTALTIEPVTFVKLLGLFK